MPSRAPRPLPASQPAPAGSRAGVPWLVAAGVTAFVFICYWPLTRFYLAQDDFILLERATHGFGAAMAPFFKLDPGQFRPLTKGFYFLVAWPLFGLNPLPYHVISILLHALNALLAGVLLRRMNVSAPVSWMGAVVFAAHLCHIEAVAWASCVQQLAGAAFVFTAMIFALDAMAGRGRRRGIAATVAYGLALSSYEQTMAAPFVLLLWQWLHNRRRDARPLLPMFALFGVYAIYALILRGMPESGPYVMSMGKNVLVNLREYTILAVSVWHVYPAYMLVTGFGAAPLVWAALVLAHGMLRTWRELAFGVLAFFAFLAPVMFTTAHTHSFHLYVPEIALVFLLVSAADSALRPAGERWRRVAVVALAALSLVVAVGSAFAVRENVRAVLDPRIPLPRLFVLRRAVIAENLCRDVKSLFDHTSPRLYLVYPGNPEAKANWRNSISAVGDGSGIRLALGEPDLDVVFVPPAELPEAPKENEILLFSELGRVMTVREWGMLREQMQQDPAAPMPGTDE